MFYICYSVYTGEFVSDAYGIVELPKLRIVILDLRSLEIPFFFIFINDFFA